MMVKISRHIPVIALLSTTLFFNSCGLREAALSTGILVGGVAPSSHTYPFYYNQPFYFFAGTYLYGGYFKDGFYFHEGKKYEFGHYYEDGFRYHNGNKYKAQIAQLGYYMNVNQYVNRSQFSNRDRAMRRTRISIQNKKNAIAKVRVAHILRTREIEKYNSKKSKNNKSENIQAGSLEMNASSKK